MNFSAGTLAENIVPRSERNALINAGYSIIGLLRCLRYIFHFRCNNFPFTVHPKSDYLIFGAHPAPIFAYLSLLIVRACHIGCLFAAVPERVRIPRAVQFELM